MIDNFFKEVENFNQVCNNFSNIFEEENKLKMTLERLHPEAVQINQPEWIKDIKSANNNTSIMVEQNEKILKENIALRKSNQELNLKLEAEKKKKFFSSGFCFIAGAFITAFIDKIVNSLF